ncbi:6-phosphogluconolactonase [Arenibaculum pallidiluteum]|uniref:6-phosphogluconolactonase n=1 Tax=Arenibaculum pallidiluteum TaxID=2812559 RepID=UPI001A977BEE|nr:6-phosphogluconolactonase [Arenibaculum pallidiluteum]
MARLHEFASHDALFEAAADRTAALLSEALATRGEAALVLSGGRTPEPLHELLSARALAWDRVTLVLADERWVTPDHADSNEAMVRRTLVRGAAAGARLLETGAGAGDPETAAAALDARLARLPHPYAAAWLGMGEDGHTASLFPGAEGLAAALAPECPHRCVTLVPTGAPHRRLTLTLRELLDSSALCLLLTGDGKRRVLEEALGEGPAEAMPIRAVLRQERVPVEIFWAP